MKKITPIWHSLLLKHTALGILAIFVTTVSPLTYAISSELLASQVLHVNCNGNFDDQSSLGHTIENQGVTLTTDKFGYRNQACFFDGYDYLKISNNPAFNLSNMTISAWVFVDESHNGGDRRAVVSNYAGGGNAQHYGVHIDDNVVQAFYDDGNQMKGAKDTGGTSFLDGKWHHVAAVFEGGVNTKIYVDGEPKRQSSGVMPATITPTGDLYIGRGGNDEGLEERWIGSLDDIRILSQALTDDEINLLSATIDLPTGQTFTPIATPTTGSENTPFLLDNAYVDDSFLVTPNDDGSFSVNKFIDARGTRADNANDFDSSTLNIKDGEMTIIDETMPGVTGHLNLFGDLEITDENIPDLKLTMPRGSSQFIFQSISNPEITVESTGEGLKIRDSSNPDVIAVRDANGDIMIVDEESGVAGFIDENGNAVLKHPDYPNLEISLNIHDTGDSYVITDTETNDCIEVSIDSEGNLRSRNARFGFGDIVDTVKNVASGIGGTVSSGISKLFGSGSSGIGGLVSKGVSKIACFFKCNPVGSVISNVVSGGKSLASKASGFLSKATGFLGKFSSFISPVISIGTMIFDKIFGNKKYKEAIKKLEGQVKGLQNQVQTLQATVQQQETTILELKQQNATLEEKVNNLETIIAQQAEMLKQQGEQIAILNDKVNWLEAELARKDEIIAARDARIEELEKRLEDLERNTRDAKDDLDDDIPDDGEPIRSRLRGRDLRSSVQNECKSPVLPASCQVYGVQDEGLNDSIFFFNNPETHSIDQLGQTCVGCDIESMAIHPVSDKIYLGSGDDAEGHPNGHLYKLDAQTGQLQSVGNTGFDDISGLTFDDNGTFWGWAKSDGLVTIDIETGEATLQSASTVELADLTWDNNYQVLYGVVGKELWSYNPANDVITQLCSNLPNKTEAVKILPLSLSPAGIVWTASHNNSQTQLQAYKIDTCEALVDFNLSIGFDDVEGIATPVGACTQ
ncbi:MAG: LamG-like jellyroll fold domain-containing protein [Thiotrichaceae bacterium]|nr:LamG-like jellyroll fold domain-containing protein [Thiotrichaceae bacterium]